MVDYGRVVELATETYNERHHTCGVTLRVPPRASQFANADGFLGRAFIWPSIDVRPSRIDTSLFFESTAVGQAAFDALKGRLTGRLRQASVGGDVTERRIGSIGTACTVGVPDRAPARSDALLAAHLARQFADMLDAVRDIIENYGAPDDGRATETFSPLDERDARKTIMRAIADRQGQPAFRNRLMALYGGRCAITGCGLQDVLEAAHIRPFRGEHTNHEANGLLLRADLHTLLDRALIAIDPDTLTIVVAPSARGSSYGTLHGERLRPRTEGEPNADALRLNFEEFTKLHGI